MTIVHASKLHSTLILHTCANRRLKHSAHITQCWRAIREVPIKIRHFRSRSSEHAANCTISPAV